MKGWKGGVLMDRGACAGGVDERESETMAWVERRPERHQYHA